MLPVSLHICINVSAYDILTEDLFKPERPEIVPATIYPGVSVTNHFSSSSLSLQTNKLDRLSLPSFFRLVCFKNGRTAPIGTVNSWP